MVWVFAHAHREGLGDYLAAAEQGAAFVLDRFRDRRHGGFFWKTDVGGRALERRKILYGHLFLLYALVEYARAAGDSGPLGEARDLFSQLFERAHDRRHGGWVEHFGRNWRPLRLRRRGAEVEIVGWKSGNVHLHAVEALTELYRETGDADVRAALEETVDRSVVNFYPDDPGDAVSHRRRDWRSVGTAIASPGHNVEFSWLVLAAEAALGRPLGWARLDAYLEEILADSARERLWWVEAEILAALAQAVDGGIDRHEPALCEQFAFLLRHQIDPIDGVWFERVAADGKPLQPRKVGTWKDAFHEVRATVLTARHVARRAR